jgi:hypothetical protein
MSFKTSLCILVILLVEMKLPMIQIWIKWNTILMHLCWSFNTIPVIKVREQDDYNINK